MKRTQTRQHEQNKANETPNNTNQNQSKQSRPNETKQTNHNKRNETNTPKQNLLDKPCSFFLQGTRSLMDIKIGRLIIVPSPPSDPSTPYNMVSALPII